MFLLFITLTFADYCSVDTNYDGVDYNSISIYNQRYCGNVCPCSGNDCIMDFTESNQREIGNVTGEIGTLITRDFDYTFAFYIDNVFKVNKAIISSTRTQYKINDNSALSIAQSEKLEGSSKSTFTTIFRCDGECTIFDSEFIKEKENSITFISEKNDNGVEKNVVFTLQNIHFNLGFVSNQNSYIFAREHVTTILQNILFTIGGTNDDTQTYSKTPIPLFYNANGFVDVNTTVEGVNNYTLNIVCDGKWLIASPTNSVNFQCFDPTITTGSEGLEKGCNIAFIVMISLSLLTLFTILIAFAILLTIPFVKSKLRKNEDDYGVI
ncbi:Uncharacterized protein QTN25_003815 [Entamoeba marina]